MADMFDNLKHRDLMSRGPSGDTKKNSVISWIGRSFNTKCTNCRVNRATGSAQMLDRKWRNLCDHCRSVLDVKGGNGPDSSNTPHHGQGKGTGGKGRHRK